MLLITAEDEEEEEDEDEVVDAGARAEQTASGGPDTLGNLDEPLPPLLPPQTLGKHTPAHTS